MRHRELDRDLHRRGHDLHIGITGNSVNTSHYSVDPG